MDNFNIPVVANGDVRDLESARRFDFCDAVMIGRHAIKEPFIFKELNNEKVCDWEKEKRECIEKYIKKGIEFGIGIQNMKVHIQSLLKDTGRKDLITGVQKIHDVEELIARMKQEFSF